MSDDVVIVSAARTAVGSFNGAFANTPAHDLGAAAYAIRGAVAAANGDGAERLRERDWQRERIPAEVRELVLEDQRLRSPICWNVFDD